MEKNLSNSYQQTVFKLSHHGNRTVGVLKEALKGIDDAELSDMYGTGEIIEQFQIKMANILGKEAAAFFPSGTMAQQIALRIGADAKRNDRIAYHQLSHLELHEENGIRKLQPLTPILLGEKDRLFTLEELQALKLPVGCLLVELPQRELGGVLPSFSELEAISIYCRENGIHLHLDGARLWESLPYYEKTAEEICRLFDSVYVSFYKGLGGVAGAILAGQPDFIEQSIIWKRRYGGDLVSLYPYVLSADYYYEKRKDKMNIYHESAKELADMFNHCEKVYTVPKIPMTNMFQVHFEKELDESTVILEQLHQETGLGFTGHLTENRNSCSFELSLGDDFERIPREQLQQAFQLLATAM